MTWFLERVAEKTGITKNLMKAFGGNKAVVNDILTLAMFPLCGGGADLQQATQVSADIPLPIR